MCVDALGLGQDVATENRFNVQRIWKTTPKQRPDTIPCVPEVTGPYFNVAPRAMARGRDRRQAPPLSRRTRSPTLRSPEGWTFEGSRHPGDDDESGIRS